MPVVTPEPIEALFDRPGHKWSASERAAVVEWLFDGGTFGYLVRFCLLYLGLEATAADAEDAWAEFCATRLDALLVSYNPALGRRFWNYLLFCLQRECGHYRRRLTRQARNETGFEAQLQTEDGEIEFALAADHSQEPSAALEMQDTLELLNRCLAALPAHHRQAFLLVEVQQMSYAEAGARLKERPGTVRVWNCRARAALRKCIGSGE